MFISPACIEMVFSDATSEEPLASVARGRSIVLAGGSVPTYSAVLGQHGRASTRLTTARFKLHITIYNTFILLITPGN